MKKKKKKVYCADGPCQGETFKIRSGDREFWVVTSIYKRVHYTVAKRIGFVNELIAVHMGHTPRKKK